MNASKKSAHLQSVLNSRMTTFLCTIQTKLFSNFFSALHRNIQSKRGSWDHTEDTAERSVWSSAALSPCLAWAVW